MRFSNVTTLAWGSFALALVVCGGATFLALDFSARVAMRENAVTAAAQSSATAQDDAQLHSLAQNTQAGRDQLDSFLNVNVIDIAGIIQGAGKTASTTVTITGAFRVSLPAPAPSDLHALEFVVQAQGSFSHNFETAELFETLPLSASVEELDFERLGSGNSSDAWQLTAHIKVLPRPLSRR